MNDNNTTTTLWNNIMNYFSHTTLFYDDLIPPLIASIGCRLLENKHIKEPIYYVNNLPENTLNLHIVHVAPSGLSKSYIFRQFTDKKIGILPQDIIPIHMAGRMTEPAFIGTVELKKIDGETTAVVNYGLAKNYSDGILVYNEMDMLFGSIHSTASYDTQLLNQVLQAITECRISKDLAHGNIEYDTHVLLWGATQPARFDFSSGIGRRFMFIGRIWTYEDIEKLKSTRINHKHMKEEQLEYINKLRNTIKQDIKSLYNFIMYKIDNIELDIQLQNRIAQYSRTVSEMQLLERFSMGYTIMNTDISNYNENTLYIMDTQQLDYYIKQLVNIKANIESGLELYLLTEYLSKCTNQQATREQLWSYFSKLGYTFKKLQNLIEDAIKYRMVSMHYINNKTVIKLLYNISQSPGGA